MAPVRLTIFEDNSDYRESLRHLFRFTPDIEVVGAFPDCSHLSESVQTTQPQVILMDIDMPGMSGIEATEIVKNIMPSAQVIMLTVSEEEERIFRALRNGATGYLLKKSSPDELVESVRSVSRGGSPMSPAIARKVLQYFYQHKSVAEANNPQAAIPNTPPVQTAPTQTSEFDDEASALTPREREILEGLVDGLSYKMIAAKYFISPDTVKNHIQGIYKKLHVHSKGEAISFALKRGIVR